MLNKNLRVGLDIGSTTIKCVVINDNDEIVYSLYERHYSKISEKIEEVLNILKEKVFPNTDMVKLSLSGSAGMGIAEACNFPFIQEVYATRVCANKLNPDTNCIIELGGEDAKILFLTNGVEVRMNGSCAGGTGAFIDRMASLLNVSIDEMNELAKQQEKIYTIASRCGVFAKSDIQPLLNQGARKSDVSASIFFAVANQTVAGLAQGREISGNVLYLGGPLTFISELRKAFDITLKVNGICPKNSLYYVAMGAAFCSDKEVSLQDLLNKVRKYTNDSNFDYRSPLFENKEQYQEFCDRHAKELVKTLPLKEYNDEFYLGIDAGSTTVKLLLMDKDDNIRFSRYMANAGNPVPLIKKVLEEIYVLKPNINIKSCAVTGYGEDIIKNAFKVDFGVVETIAHFIAAKKFMPDVEFVIDIGGQDIKCFKIRNGAIENIFLNEACSSGCGSFLQTFSSALGYSIEDFAKLALFAKKPVNLGSRCTVFMNSAVKQAQKDGATIEDIAAGLSLSVVKNALYKVIRANTPKELGQKIVVQGGTFLNDAVLRAFELEMNTNVVRPNIAGLMGAYGAALYAKTMCINEKTTLLNKEELAKFEHKIMVSSCHMCQNNCRLTINQFNDGRAFISGNRCEKPITKKTNNNELNLMEYEQSLLESYKGKPNGKRGKIGIPLGLNMYELLPFWNTLFTELGFETVISPFSNRKLYLNGQATIPSDTVCFPAKLMHGHIKYLIDQGLQYIFYPCMSYNINEKKGSNHYNCPVVAYYPEVIDANMKELKSKNIYFIKDYVGIDKKKYFAKKFKIILDKYFDGISQKEVDSAVESAYEAYDQYMKRIALKGDEIIYKARQQGKRIIVLAGRPYHIDPEINHGIDKMISTFNVAIVTNDVIAEKVKEKQIVHVLNQWTYHARLYASAYYVRETKDMNLVQLVSFGCGVDAITTDEVRDILEQKKKIYTLIKIDEITNLGAVKIRIRSLLAALDEQDEKEKQNGKIEIR
jgi:predicted CoA-substrate-specific enzyme activase